MDSVKRLGFIGTGTITDAIIRGINGDGRSQYDIVVSPRGAGNAERLAHTYANVCIGGDNQAVVDSADMLFLAIRPQIAEEVIRPLNFPAQQLVVSLVAATPVERIATWTKSSITCIRAVPLPFVAERSGVTAIFPPHSQVADFFGRLGTAVECETTGEYETLTAVSAVMGTYFGILGVATEWLAEKGLPEAKARSYLAPLFASLGQRALEDETLSFDTLRKEFSTRGGLNEQLFATFVQHGGSAAILTGLNAVLARVQA